MENKSDVIKELKNLIRMFCDSKKYVNSGIRLLPETVIRKFEEIIKLINLAASQMKENSTAIDLSAKIFEISAQINPLPTEITNKILINELQSLF